MILSTTRSNFTLWLIWLGALGLFFAYMQLALTQGWLGPLMSDDFSYLGGALRVLTPETYVPLDHWEVRHTVTLPLALIVSYFGLNEVSLVLPSSLFFVGTAFVIGLWVYQKFDHLAGLLAPIVLILTPVSIQQFSTLNVDIVEAFFWFSSVFLFLNAKACRHPLLCLYIAGLCVGLAVMSRETSAALLLGYGIFFLFGLHIPRKYYWMMAAGFITVLATEMIYYTVVVGSPIHRYEILFSAFGAGSVETTGNLVTNPVIGPVAALFVNNEFGFLFPLATISIWYLVKKQQLFFKSELGLLLALGAIHFVVCAYFLGLRPLPRYFTIQAYVAAIPVTLVIANLIRIRRYQKYIGLAGAGMIATHYGLVDLSNNSPRLGERVYASYVMSSEVVYSDPLTCARGKMLFRLQQGLADNSEPLCSARAQNTLLVISDKNLTDGNLWGVPFDASKYRRLINGKPIAVIKGRQTNIGQFLTFAGLPSGGMLPDRLYTANVPVKVYRLGPM